MGGTMPGKVKNLGRAAGRIYRGVAQKIKHEINNLPQPILKFKCR
jgi:hypothetical protein